MQTAATTINANLETIKGAIAAKFDTATFTSWIAPLTFDIEKKCEIYKIWRNND